MRYVNRVYQARLHEFKIFGQYIARKYPTLNWEEDPWREITNGWSSQTMSETLSLRGPELEIISKQDQNQYDTKLNGLTRAKYRLEHP